MKTQRGFLLVITILVAGCATRSISNSQYSGGYYGGNALYQGELSEFDVLGVSAGAQVSDEEIRDALAEAPERMTLKKGDPILLIQSGAMIPDEEMLEELKKTFSVSVFTGVPEKEKSENASYSNSLRLAAAKGGIGTIVVYWGVLESGTTNLATKTVSWVPIVGSAVPDETQHMRIRLKVAVIDVRTGRWEVFTPETFDDKAVSGRINRAQSDQAQVAALKSAAYEVAAREIMLRYIR